MLLTTKQVKELSPRSVDSDPSDPDASGSEEEGNAGWADSIQKVLKTTKPETQNKTVLARAKKSQSKSNKGKSPEYDFEIDGADGKRGDEVKPQVSALDAQLTQQQRRNVPLQLRVKPSYKDMERERNLRKVATRGVVQFFNAVRVQQKDLQQQLEEAGPLDSRQDAVLNNISKRKFLDVLMSGKRAKSAAIDNPVKKEESETDEDETSPGTSAGKKKSEWNVLRDDFMTNKKIKHWDEEDDEASGEDNEDADATDSNDDD